MECVKDSQYFPWAFLCFLTPKKDTPYDNNLSQLNRYSDQTGPIFVKTFGVLFLPNKRRWNISLLLERGMKWAGEKKKKYLLIHRFEHYFLEFL